MAGPWARPSRAVNVGYLMFNALSRLWWATGFDPGWVAVAATGRQLLGTAMAASPHLPPDWSQVRADGSVLATSAPDGRSPRFGYGSAWLALGRLWLDTSRLGGCATA